MEFASELRLGGQIWSSGCWRERGDEKNKPEVDSISTVPIYILFMSRFPPLINVYHFIGNTDVTGKADDLMDVRIRYTDEGLLRGLIK